MSPTLGKPVLHIMRHPTFGCFMDWYVSVTERRLPVNPIALDLQHTVHRTAKENEHRIPYTETVEALTTAYSFLRVPPLLDDWRLWRTLDSLKITGEMLNNSLERGADALALGGNIPGMMTPDFVTVILPLVAEVKFFQPSQRIEDAYTPEERRAAFYGKFAQSVVSGWKGIGSTQPTMIGGYHPSKQHTRVLAS